MIDITSLQFTAGHRKALNSQTRVTACNGLKQVFEFQQTCEGLENMNLVDLCGSMPRLESLWN